MADSNGFNLNKINYGADVADRDPSMELDAARVDVLTLFNCGTTTTQEAARMPLCLLSARFPTERLTEWQARRGADRALCCFWSSCSSSVFSRKSRRGTVLEDAADDRTAWLEGSLPPGRRSPNLVE